MSTQRFEDPQPHPPFAPHPYRHTDHGACVLLYVFGYHIMPIPIVNRTDERPVCPRWWKVGDIAVRTCADEIRMLNSRSMAQKERMGMTNNKAEIFYDM